MAHHNSVSSATSELKYSKSEKQRGKRGTSRQSLAFTRTALARAERQTIKAELRQEEAPEDQESVEILAPDENYDHDFVLDEDDLADLDDFEWPEDDVW